jgi:hypothetical protein
MLYVSGYRGLEKTPELDHVGCESCHGAGYNHSVNELDDYQEIFTECETCHNHEHSPNFDKKRDEYFKKIQHWTEPRKYWE